MELPSRPAGDEFLKPGELRDIRRRLRRIAARHDLTSVIACAFDHRTRMLPFVFAATRMVPAGVRAIASAMIDSGFTKTRIVLQQWNPLFSPSKMRLDGRVPDLFMISSMQIHGDRARQLIAEAHRIDPARRPLIITGGPKVIYEPWDMFSADPSAPYSADVAVTGEAYVLLNLLEVLLNERADGESIRQAFIRARDRGLLDEVPGLVYARSDEPDGPARELVDTGIQRIVGDLDELPDPVAGYSVLEPPHSRASLTSRPLEASRVRRYSPIAAIVLTFGCKFNCPYCGIPAYNQRKLRGKSGQRIVEDMCRLHEAYGLRYFFGTDDNFFSNANRAIDICQTLARTQINGKPLRKIVRWGTEVTVHDTLKMADQLRLVRKAGVRALWLGVEDMTATLVNKGQSVEKTTQVFRLLRQRGISPMAMMMHHDSQPLYTRKSHYGLLNQVALLRKAGAVDMQVLMITPAPGSKIYEQTFRSGMVYRSAAGRVVEQYMMDGNYVVA